MTERPLTRTPRNAPWSPWRSIHLPLLCKNSCRQTAGIVDVDQNADVNVLVLDTQVYSNTGGQRSKATPMAAFAKFASSGKETARKDLGLYAMSYGHVYVASVALGAKDAQTLRAFSEAEAYEGPSLVIAYAPCIAHGYDLSHGAQHQKLAVDSGMWPLFRFDPRRADRGEPPLALDATPGKATVAEYMNVEDRFAAASGNDDQRRLELRARAEREVARRARLYAELARFRPPTVGERKDGA